MDSTWNQTNTTVTESSCRGCYKVELKTRKIFFWCHQKGKSDTFLSTVEAIYCFLVDYYADLLKEKHKGQYDNLLFFYSFMYQFMKNAKYSGAKQTTKLTSQLPTSHLPLYSTKVNKHILVGKKWILVGKRQAQATGDVTQAEEGAGLDQGGSRWVVRGPCCIMYFKYSTDRIC